MHQQKITSNVKTNMEREVSIAHIHTDAVCLVCLKGGVFFKQRERDERHFDEKLQHKRGIIISKCDF